MVAVLDYVHELLCRSTKPQGFFDGEWRNATWGSVPSVSSCAQHAELSWLPNVYLAIVTPLVLYQLSRSENPRASSASWVNIRSFVTAFLAAGHVASLIAHLYFKAPHVAALGDCVQIMGTVLVFTLNVAARNRGCGSSGFLFCYWLLSFLCALPEVIHSFTQLATRVKTGNVVSALIFLFIFTGICANLVMSCFADDYKRRTKNKRLCPENVTSFLNQITFYWFTDIAVKGHKRPLTADDLWDLNERDKAKRLIPQFEHHFRPPLEEFLRRKASSRAPISEKQFPSVIWPICKTHKWTLIIGAMYKLIFDLLQFVAPKLLKELISFIQDKERPMIEGIFIAALLFISAAFQSMVLHQYFHEMFRLGMNVQSQLTSAVYKKAMNLSNTARKNRTIGEIVNLMFIDVRRFQEMCSFVMLFWSAPLQVLLSIYFLWNLLGVAVLAGLIILIATLPFNAWVSVKMRNMQVIQMKHKDERLKMMTEVLNGMKVLKLYSWERSMQTKIREVREKEITILKKIAFLNAVTSLSWACAPFLVAVLTFGVYVKIDPENNVLTPQTTFVALALFNILRFPLAIFSMIISQAVQCAVSNKRLKSYFADDEMQNCAKIDNLDDDEVFRIENGFFGWDNTDKTVLRDINISVKRGELIGIVGRVGSGKSSILSAALGEAVMKSGRIAIKGDVAYVPQQPWIQNLTLKDNILFNRPYDSEFYEKVLDACALRQDLASLPAEDLTEIGEKGINLSGGQKQRVSLARAVYSQNDVVLLDDPLSAVDAHVGKHIFEHVISSATGILREKTRIFVTHGIHNLKYMDRVFVVKDGEISESGTYKELLAKKGPFSEFIQEFLVEEVAKRGRSVSFGEDGGDVEEILSALEHVDPAKKAELRKQLSQSEEKRAEEVKRSTSRQSAASTRTERSKRTQSEDVDDDTEEENDNEAARDTEKGAHFEKNGDALPLIKKGADKQPDGKGKIIEKEAMETGKVKWAVYMSYLQAIGYVIAIIFCSVYLFSSILGVGSNLWLAHWSDEAKAIQSNAGGEDKTNQRLIIYTLLGMGQAITICIASVIMALGMVKASRILHEGILHATLHAPMSFLDVTPIGRIVNRFGKDVEALDAALPTSLRSLVVTGMSAVCTVCVIFWSTPQTIPPLLVLVVIYVFVLRFYVSTSRQLKRLDSTTRSPIFSHFQESIQGATSVRAYHLTDAFIAESSRRVDSNLACYYPSIVANRWLAVRLELVGNLIVLFAALFAVFFRESDGLTAGLVGLSVSYALNITQTLNWAVRMTSELETNIVAVERIKEYADQKIEGLEGEKEPGKSGWPTDGVITFSDYTMRYREGLDLVLKGVNIHVHEREKVGIVGRTGAGKSSLTLALFRIVEADSGHIEIDGERLDKIKLETLRSRLTIVPQDPVLFSGSLRHNLDPFDKHSDAEVWEALDESHLKSFVESLSDGLNHGISESGENLSIGQRQLICLARALLRKTKVLVLDEAAASVDMETDALIQKAIREHFKECTVLTIAHRLNTILDYDKIIVMQDGRVVECDTPKTLLANQDSVFHSMAEDAGIVESH